MRRFLESPDVCAVWNRFFVGIGSSLGAIGITLSGLEAYVRFAGAIVGLCIAIVTLAAQIRAYRKS